MGKKMVYKSVYFDLPYLIYVKDGFKDKSLEEWTEAYSNDEDDLPYSPYAPRESESNYLSIGGGFPVYLPPDELSEPYVIKLNESILVGVQFLKRINQNSTTKLCGEVIGDRTGRAAFSSVRVNFDLKIFKPEIYWDMQHFVSLSIDAVNKFIEHYRIIADRFYIKPITPQIIQTFKIISNFSDDTSKTQTFGIGSGPLHGLGGSISDDKDQYLRKVMYKNEQPSIIDSLKIEIKNKLDLREWRLAVIDSAILFETWLSKLLYDHYRDNGLSESDIFDKFHKDDKYNTPLSAYALAKYKIKDDIGFDFGDCQEFDNWCTDTKDLRNKVVHGDKYRVSKEEAEKAFKSSLDAMRVIKDNT